MFIGSVFNAPRKGKKMKRVLLYTWLIVIAISGLSAEGLLYKNRETIIKLLKKEKISLGNTDKIYRKDREIVLMAVDGYNYEYIDASLKNDKEIIGKAIERGLDIRKADENMSNDRALVLLSIKSNIDNFEFVKDKFKKDKAFVFEVVKEYHPNFQYADESIKKDREFFLKMVKESPNISYYAKELLKNDK